MPVMSGFRVGLGNEIVNSRYSATAFARADYLTAAGGPAYHPGRCQSEWQPVRLQLRIVLTRSMASRRRVSPTR
jgi:hypothetical protein